MGFHPIKLTKTSPVPWDYGITPVLKLGLWDYRTPPMGALVVIYITDILLVWYIKRSRNRYVWSLFYLLFLHFLTLGSEQPYDVA